MLIESVENAGTEARLQLVMKSGKYSLGYKTTLKTLRLEVYNAWLVDAL